MTHKDLHSGPGLARRTLLALPLLVRPSLGAVPEWSDDGKADFLRRAPVISVKILKSGVTSSHRATLRRDGVTHDAHIQTVDESGLWGAALNLDRGFADSYRYNLAAYELNRILDLNHIPVTVARAYRDKPASYTWWVDRELMTERDRQARRVRPPSGTVWNEQVYLMKVFDQLICNVDRNTGNIVIDADWKLWMIDHTRSFRNRPTLPNENDISRCDRLLLERLRRLDESTVRARLSAWVQPAQLDALLARRDRIVDHFDRLAVQMGAERVFYEYLVDKP